MHERSAAWEGLSPAEHELQYNPQRAFPDYANVRTRLAPHNDAARRALGNPEEVAFGPDPLHRLDVFRAEGPGPHPVHVFYHGGYWRAQDKANFAFVAGMLVPRGVTTVIANYELCPAATLDGVTRSALNGFRWVAENAETIGGDPARITLSGHSAGAHIGASILADQDVAESGARLAGVVLTSGIFDPRPARFTSVNDQLKLTEEVAANNDVERRPPRQSASVCLLAGARETTHWIDQSFRYYHHLRSHGIESEMHLLPGHDHFDILEDYLQPAGTTLEVILRQCGLSGGRP